MRRARLLIDNAVYHVYSRANHYEMLLDNVEMKHLFVSVLEEAKTRFSFSVQNFVVMGNHFHLIIKPTAKHSLSVIMKWILQVFAMRYNKKTGSWGHFWGSRFKSSIIPHIQEYLRVFIYIDENPVSANIVGRCWEWQWGGLWHHRKSRSSIVDPLPRWLKLFVGTHEPLMLPC